MRYFVFIFSFFIASAGFSNKTASEIYVDLEKVHSLKRVLYIAAHPDDENTRALAWFSLGEKAETAYLSLTRGDGGQNLIGDELSEDLGVLRTQELLAARGIDGARQYFTRAVDFGYSKSAQESLEKWGKDDILSDVVLVIRQFKPDVIITRFPADKRAGHGHHTAATLLALEAFEKAADPNYLPEQVQAHGAWKTTSIYWNSSVWWDKELSTTAKNDPKYLVQEIGGYNSHLGMSYNEIGTLARSQHKCQGFGAIVERGSLIEYFQHLDGKQLENSFFENNTMSWTKLVSNKFSDEFDALLADFDFKVLENNVPALLSIRKKLNVVPASNLDAIRKEKVAEIDRIIVDCLGLYAEIVSSDYAYVQGEEFTVNYNLTNRSSRNVQLMSMQGKEMVLLLQQNKTLSKEVTINNSSDYSTPYWLKNPFVNLFKIDDPADLGKAEGDATFSEKLTFIIDGDQIQLEIPVTHKWRDPSYGERRRNVISAPDYSVNFDQKSIILKPGQEKTIRVKIHAYKEKLTDEIIIKAPEGWQVSPEKIEINTTARHEEVWAEITIKSNEQSKRGDLVLADSNGKPLKSLTEITYDHIPTQVIYKPASLICIPLKADIVAGNVAYIKGAGDAVAQATTQLGFNVTEYEVSDLATLDLSKFQSVILGIRIYNIHPELHNFDAKLFKYVSDGGNLVMQYNTAGRSSSGQSFGPIPFELSRKRVTEEDSKVTFLAPDHQIMNKPNKITQVDFEGWVQERGLYFADNWNEAYTPLFSWNDTGEDPVNGALIVAKHGKGQFVYTGISFFRELPNGVAGAYRLFANILSYQQ
ncbi:MAG: LmbE family protein [Crocinitomix sp.]|nr:LmbE family protein [Crocinitomix sp.]